MRLLLRQQPGHDAPGQRLDVVPAHGVQPGDEIVTYRSGLDAPRHVGQRCQRVRDQHILTRPSSVDGGLADTGPRRDGLHRQPGETAVGERL